MKLQNLLLPVSFATFALAGPISYGICQSGCAVVVVACYSGAGFVFGTVPGAVAAAVPAVLAWWLDGSTVVAGWLVVVMEAVVALVFEFWEDI
ncbi:unnamed protein product [Tuber aestivum]|uniref:Uncharacterized protein n=1 Tax=Tuber aestivum TaxID=59557 RepID=A0A292PHP5_9PEZI|nr:unnamed protein product [Tuber aestivum]